MHKTFKELKNKIKAQYGLKWDPLTANFKRKPQLKCGEFYFLNYPLLLCMT